jgi:hypothetical protein
MATLANNVLTLVDWAKRIDPDGQTAAIVELLAQTNSILDDMLFQEGNLPTGHRTTVRTSLPTPAWRLLNQGVNPSKSTTAQVDEACGMLEAYSEIDADLVKLNGTDNGFRLSEASAFLEAMNQEMAQTLFYGNAGLAPEEFTGLSPRYAASTGITGQNIIKAGGAGSDNSSVWLVLWGANSLFGMFPKGSQAGIMHEDLGLVTIETANGIGGGRMRAYRDHWQWKLGIALRDWRYAVRICNIDISNLVTESSAADLIKVMLKAIHRIPSLKVGRPTFYANRTIMEMLDIQAMQKNNLYLTVGNEEGNRKVSLRGIPIQVCDQLLETEALVP